ncbi:hypothetical protein MBANPS3_011146 [Mucor bainieri]
MPIDDRYVPSGWLHKSARFSLLHPPKMRYFVLLDKELRYYKHPDDTHAAGVIELGDFQDIEEHNSTTSDLFGFRLVSETNNKGHFIPMLYAETKQERHLWMKRIKANLNRLSNCSHYCSPHFCSLESHPHRRGDGDHGHPHALLSVLDRWLNKLDLYDGSDEDADYVTRQSSNNSSPNHSRSNSSVGGHSSKHNNRSTESIHTSDYSSSSSLYSEPATVSSSSYASSFSHGHTNQRQYSTPTKYNPMSHHHQHHHLQARQNSLPVSSHRSTNPSSPQHQSPTALKPNNASVCHSSQTTPSRAITKLLSIESERLKYAETTLQYYQHPHIHRSTSTKFCSELGISLSPPPPRR